jgi:hypothetical protein
MATDEFGALSSAPDTLGTQGARDPAGTAVTRIRGLMRRELLSPVAADELVRRAGGVHRAVCAELEALGEPDRVASRVLVAAARLTAALEHMPTGAGAGSAGRVPHLGEHAS